MLPYNSAYKFRHIHTLKEFSFVPENLSHKIIYTCSQRRRNKWWYFWGKIWGPTCPRLPHYCLKCVAFLYFTFLAGHRLPRSQARKDWGLKFRLQNMQIRWKGGICKRRLIFTVVSRFYVRVPQDGGLQLFSKIYYSMWQKGEQKAK